MDNEQDDSGITVGSVTEQEHRLLIRGLECLKLVLLEEAGDMADQKLSKKAGKLSDLVSSGKETLAQLKILNKLRSRLKALIGEHDSVG